MKLRDYQQAAVESVVMEFKEKNSTLIVMPTGTGKTQTFCEVIRRMMPLRAMVIAHREELIYQAKNRLISFDLAAEVEMADNMAEAGFWSGKTVVSTIQTQIAGPDGGRMNRFSPNDFGLVVVDEAHHATADTYKRVLAYYRTNPKLKILGVTATPDRADEEALGQVFESVAYDYEVIDAINDGWLVPIHQQLVSVDGLDFSSVRTTAGDLNGADLAAVMEAEKTMQGVASASLEIIGEKKALVFTSSVRQSEMLCEIFNRHRPDMAAWVCGKTPKDKRREMLKDFARGKIQVMVNCAVLTEGFDDVSIEVIIQARPTKSRALYSQMVGRGTRPLTGTVDACATPEERAAAIAASAKPKMLVVDFVGNSGRHKLMTAADILGGKVSEQAVERALEKMRLSGEETDMAAVLEAEEEKLREEIEDAKRREAARRAQLIGKAKYSVRSINPFDVLQLEPERVRGWDKNKTLTEKQTALLLKNGVDPTAMPYSQARQVLNDMFRRWNNNLATLQQCSLLQKKGLPYDKHTTREQAGAMLDSAPPSPKQAALLMRFGYTNVRTGKEASKLIDALAKNGWRKP